MRKAGDSIKLAVCLSGQGGAVLDAVLGWLSRSGARGIELRPRAFFPDPAQVLRRERAEFRRRIEKHGLRLVGFHGVLEGYRSLGFFAGEATVRQTVQLLKEQVKLCQELGGSVVTVGSPAERSHGLRLDPDVSIPLAAEVFRRLVPVCESRRVILAVDPALPDETDFIRSFDEGCRLLSEVRHRCVRLALDLHAWNQSGASLAALLQERLPYIAHVRAREPAGAALPHARFGEALVAAGYKGWVSLDQGPGVIPEEPRLAPLMARLKGCYA